MPRKARCCCLRSRRLAKEMHMKSNARWFSHWGMLFALAVAMVGAAACNSGSSTKKVQSGEAAAARAEASGAAHNPAPNIDLNCVVARLQSPPDSFHYSYKMTEPTRAVDEEADVTPQMIDGFIQNTMGGAGSTPMTSKIHALRSDDSNWRIATGSFGNSVAAMALGIALMYHSPAVAASEGADTVNGYSATKYSFDTDRGSLAENAIMLGQGGSLKGTIWALPDGCPVKMILDQESHSGNQVEKDHYEENMVKK
jgi:hypothetical protein